MLDDIMLYWHSLLKFMYNDLKNKKKNVNKKIQNSNWEKIELQKTQE